MPDAFTFQIWNPILSRIWTLMASVHMQSFTFLCTFGAHVLLLLLVALHYQLLFGTFLTNILIIQLTAHIYLSLWLVCYKCQCFMVVCILSIDMFVFVQVCEQFKILAPFGVQVYCIYGGTRYEPQVYVWYMCCLAKSVQ